MCEHPAWWLPNYPYLPAICTSFFIDTAAIHPRQFSHVIGQISCLLSRHPLLACQLPFRLCTIGHDWSLYNGYLRSHPTSISVVIKKSARSPWLPFPAGYMTAGIYGKVELNASGGTNAGKANWSLPKAWFFFPIFLPLTLQINFHCFNLIFCRERSFLFKCFSIKLWDMSLVFLQFLFTPHERDWYKNVFNIAWTNASAYIAVSHYTTVCCIGPHKIWTCQFSSVTKLGRSLTNPCTPHCWLLDVYRPMAG